MMGDTVSAVCWGNSAKVVAGLERGVILLEVFAMP
jgi:hypothetical protein